MGGGVWRWGKRVIIYLSLHCHHQNDFCLKAGGDESHFNESHFNVSLTVMDKVTRQCPQTTTFEEKGEPERKETGILPTNALDPNKRAAKSQRLCLQDSRGQGPAED